MIETIWVKDLLVEIGEKLRLPVIVHDDNQAAINIAQGEANNAKVKLIEINFHFIMESMQGGTVKLNYIQTKDQLADGFTKALQGLHFTAFKSALALPIRGASSQVLIRDLR